MIRIDKINVDRLLAELTRCSEIRCLIIQNESDVEMGSDDLNDFITRIHDELKKKSFLYEKNYTPVIILHPHYIDLKFYFNINGQSKDYIMDKIASMEKEYDKEHNIEVRDGVAYIPAGVSEIKDYGNNDKTITKIVFCSRRSPLSIINSFNSCGVSDIEFPGKVCIVDSSFNNCDDLGKIYFSFDTSENGVDGVNKISNSFVGLPITRANIPQSCQEIISSFCNNQLVELIFEYNPRYQSKYTCRVDKSFNNQPIKKVVITPNIVSLDNSFMACSSLDSVEIHDRYIYSFGYANNTIDSVYGLRFLGEKCFLGSGVKSINYPYSLMQNLCPIPHQPISKDMFINCLSLSYYEGHAKYSLYADDKTDLVVLIDQNGNISERVLTDYADKYKETYENKDFYAKDTKEMLPLEYFDKCVAEELVSTSGICPNAVYGKFAADKGIICLHISSWYVYSYLPRTLTSNQRNALVKQLDYMRSREEESPNYVFRFLLCSGKYGPFDAVVYDYAPREYPKQRPIYGSDIADLLGLSSAFGKNIKR